jgi:hypothetical protein
MHEGGKKYIQKTVVGGFSREGLFWGFSPICLLYITSNLRVIFFTFSEMKIRACHNFEVLFFTLRKARKQFSSKKERPG